MAIAHPKAQIFRITWTRKTLSLDLVCHTAQQETHLNPGSPESLKPSSGAQAEEMRSAVLLLRGKFSKHVIAVLGHRHAAASSTLAHQPPHNTHTLYARQILGAQSYQESHELLREGFMTQFRS